MSLQEKIQAEVLRLEGPIVIFGAGGFIGANLLRCILQYRQDVFAVTSKPFIPWRLDDINPASHTALQHYQERISLKNIFKEPSL
jgi:nucleoside-diphosphate-sugar epimerase